ncbi:MAG: polysaccharide deacetylase family protein [Janthinobacterium lividum]
MPAFDHVRRLCGALAASCCLLSSPLHAQSVALSFDDGPSLAATPLLSPQARNDAMLAALAKHGVQAALFVTAGFGTHRPEGMAMAMAWGLAGHVIANHTVTHPDLDDPAVTLAQYQQEVLDCDRVIAALPGYKKWFRFPYLREGGTPEKREGMRAFLDEQGYRNARVTLDTADWRLNGELLEALAKDPRTDLEPFRQAYLAQVRERAQTYRELAWRLQGRDIPHVALLHHNLINALWLDDVITLFEDMGWTITSPAHAYGARVYQLAPKPPAPALRML